MLGLHLDSVKSGAKMISLGWKWKWAQTDPFKQLHILRRVLEMSVPGEKINKLKPLTEDFVSHTIRADTC